MSTKIRLARGGAKKSPYYRIVVASSRSKRDGSFIEIIGHYNPCLAKDNAERVVLKADRFQYWISTGAQPTDVVAKLAQKHGVQLNESIETRLLRQKNNPKRPAKKQQAA